ncbi:MAG: hypothetical protein RL336_1241 [Pseudomonadota bacterium]
MDVGRTLPRNPIYAYVFLVNRQKKHRLGGVLNPLVMVTTGAMHVAV